MCGFAASLLPPSTRQSDVTRSEGRLQLYRPCRVLGLLPVTYALGYSSRLGPSGPLLGDLRATRSLPPTPSDDSVFPPFDLSVPSILAIALQTFPRFCLSPRHIDCLIPRHVFTSSRALLTYSGSGDYLPLIESGL